MSVDLTDYWFGKLDIDYRRLKNFWKKQSKRLARELTKRDVEDLNKICTLFGIERGTEVKEEITNLIVASNSSIEVLCIIDYYEAHVRVIEAYLQREEVQNLLTLQDLTNHLLGLMKIYKLHPDHLVNMHLLFKWNRLEEGETYYCYRPLTDNEMDLFSAKMISIAMYLKTKDPLNFSYRIIGLVKQDNDNFFMVQRQTNYRSDKNFDRTRIKKPVDELLFKFNLEEKKLESRYKAQYKRENQAITKRIVRQLKKHIDRWFEKPEENLVDEIDMNNLYGKFCLSEEELQEEDLDTLKITGIEISQVNLPEGVGLHIPKHSEDIRPALQKLEQDQIVTQQILYENTQAIWVVWKKRKPRKVEIDRSKRPLLFLKPTMHHLNSEDRLSFQTDFGNAFIPLGSPIDLSNVPEEEGYLINSLLSKQTIPTPSAHIERMATELAGKEFIKVRSKNKVLCKVCGFLKPVDSNERPERCEECNSTRLITLRSSKTLQIELNKKGILKYLKAILLRDEIPVVRMDAQRTFLLDKHTFMEIEINGKHAFLYLEEGKITPKQLKFFNKSGMPIIVIALNDTASRSLIEEHSFLHYTKLFDIYLKDKNNQLEGEHFKNIFNDLVRESTAQLIHRASDSSQVIKRVFIDKTETNDGNQFEEDCYNLLGYIFANAERWGQILKGRKKELPDGIGGITYNSTQYAYQGCVVWDCKYTESQADLGIAEKRKAVTYVEKISKEKLFAPYGNRITSYVIITPSPKRIQFKHYTKYIKENTSWQGITILLHPEVLFLLYDYINTKPDIFERKKNEFNKFIYKLFCLSKPSEIYRDITKDYVVDNLGSLVTDSELKESLANYLS